MRPRVLLLAAVAAATLLACGPSLRRSHRASAYFEECYAADLDNAVSDTERRACWQAWSRGYLTGASPERLDYVHERLAMLDPDRAAAIALATGDDGSIETIEEASVVTDEEALAAAPVVDPVTEPAPSTDAAAAPVPSEAAPMDHRDETQIAEERHQRAHERHLHRSILAPRTLTPRCPCESEWQACSAACLADDAGCIGACRREHTLCSRSCY
jgi:hypothetical protein